MYSMARCLNKCGAAVDIGVVKATTENFYQNMLGENMWEDIDVSDLYGVDELETAVTAFNEATRTCLGTRLRHGNLTRPAPPPENSHRWTGEVDEPAQNLCDLQHRATNGDEWQKGVPSMRRRHHR